MTLTHNSNNFLVDDKKFCKSLLCSMFNEQTCTRFTWLLFVTMPKISLKTLKCYIFEKPKVRGHQN